MTPEFVVVAASNQLVCTASAEQCDLIGHGRGIDRVVARVATDRQRRGHGRIKVSGRDLVIAVATADDDPSAGGHLEVDGPAGCDTRDPGDPVGVVRVVTHGDLVVAVTELEDPVIGQQGVADRFQARVADRGVGLERDGPRGGVCEAVRDGEEAAGV